MDKPTAPMASSVPAGSTVVEAATPARIYNCLLGGKDNYAADRAAADRIRAAFPEAEAAAWANRGFHHRAARWIARRGITQFIDLGCGLPHGRTTCQAVQAITPDARVVYVDHDPMVTAHLRALLPRTDAATVIEADLRDPAALLTALRHDPLLDLTQPAGLLCTAVLQFIDDTRNPHACLAHLTGALAPGSYLAVSHLTSDHMSNVAADVLCSAYQNASEQLHPRTRRQTARFFDALELVPPYDGAAPRLCHVGLWGADDPAVADDSSSRWWWAAVACVPAPGRPPR